MRALILIGSLGVLLAMILGTSFAEPEATTSHAAPPSAESLPLRAERLALAEEAIESTAEPLTIEPTPGPNLSEKVREEWEKLYRPKEDVAGLFMYATKPRTEFLLRHKELNELDKVIPLHERAELDGIVRAYTSRINDLSRREGTIQYEEFREAKASGLAQLIPQADREKWMRANGRRVMTQGAPGDKLWIIRCDQMPASERVRTFVMEHVSVEYGAAVVSWFHAKGYLSSAGLEKRMDDLMVLAMNNGEDPRRRKRESRGPRRTRQRR